MAYSDEHKEIINRHRPMLEQMKAGGFSGFVSNETRLELETVAHHVDWKLMICWTCGGSVQHMARIILNCE